jgi:2-C-methyl-D-erythritol 4-phosphate cytidylyltransferase/2-C-methyl-D-erythritol 2,4-cyclodiphosphate synthase
MSGCIALVVAAGRGSRFGSETPKQYLDLAGEPVLRRALKVFAGHRLVSAVRPVINMDDRDLFEAAALGLDILEPTGGGATRQESARLGLESLTGLNPDKVLIHDAARAFVGGGVISRVIAALEDAPGAIPVLPVTDTLKRGLNGQVGETVSRDGLWRAQTPQGFRFQGILDAHRAAVGGGFTDDAAVAEKVGLAVALVAGSEDNIKITTPQDMIRGARMAGGGEVRTGFGFDIHRLGPGGQVTLLGVTLPFRASLEGHSDADVGLHAITDALLGAIADGDIGAHFPPGDEKWRGSASDVFLRHAGGLVGEKGAVISNIDVTIICEAPKIAPHRQAMALRVAEILDIEVGRVSVKATTTERLGLTGRGEGIAAQAVATVRYLVV